MIQEGLELMAVGMGTVFSFLVLLVVCMTIIGKIFARFSHLFPDPEPAGATPNTRKPAPAPAGPAPTVAVAIAAARRHRSRR